MPGEVGNGFYSVELLCIEVVLCLVGYVCLDAHSRMLPSPFSLIIWLGLFTLFHAEHCFIHWDTCTCAGCLPDSERRIVLVKTGLQSILFHVEHCHA